MKHWLLFLLSFYCFLASAQNPNWFDNQSNKKIIKREVFLINETTQARRLEFVEEFDKKGNLIFSKNTTRYESGFQKKNIFAGDSCISYSCTCKDINTFISKFKIINSKTYKRQSGSGSGNGPTESVSITKFDKRHNAILEKQYAPSGLNVLTTTCTYDKKNNRLSSVTINLDDEETQNERFVYNSKGQKTEQFSKYTLLKSERHSLFEYDESNRVTDLQIFEEGKLTTHLHFSFVHKGDTILHVQENRLDNTSRIKKGEVIDSKGQVLKSLIYYNGHVQNSTEYKYDDHSHQISIIHYNAENEIVSELNYTFDAKGNWKTLETSELVHVAEGKTPPRKEYQKHFYIQEIQYK